MTPELLHTLAMMFLATSLFLIGGAGVAVSEEEAVTLLLKHCRQDRSGAALGTECQFNARWEVTRASAGSVGNGRSHAAMLASRRSNRQILVDLVFIHSTEASI